jgi:hypothetical protein
MLVRSILLQARLEHGGQTAWRQQQPTAFIYFRF